MGQVKPFWAVLACAAALAGTSAQAKSETIAEGARYVAMGSSFAAGPGVGPITAGTPPRCGRGTLNLSLIHI